MSDPETVGIENNDLVNSLKGSKENLTKVKEKSSVPCQSNIPVRNATLDDEKEKTAEPQPVLKPSSTKVNEKKSSVPCLSNIPTKNAGLEEEEKEKEMANKEREAGIVASASELKARKNASLLMPSQRSIHSLTSPRRSGTPHGKEVSPEELDQISSFASLCVLDAFQGRLSSGLATNSKKSKLIYLIFCVQTSELFLNIVVYSSIIHTLMTFFEDDANTSLVQLCHVAIFLVQFCDFAMKIFYQGQKDYFKTGWHYIFTASILAHFLDLCWNGCTYYSDPLRPVVGLLRSRSGRRFFSVVQKMIPTFSQSLAPLTGFILIVTFLSFSVFRLDNNLTSMLSVAYNWIWLVLTNDSFSRLYEDGVSLLHTLFFFTALYLGQRFIMSIFLAATFDTFGKFTKKQVKTEKLKELQGNTLSLGSFFLFLFSIRLLLCLC
jgi:hypothetical protein